MPKKTVYTDRQKKYLDNQFITITPKLAKSLGLTATQVKRYRGKRTRVAKPPVENEAIKPGTQITTEGLE